MATIAELANDVYVITNRPDLVTETAVALRKAIRKFHGADLWQRDLATYAFQTSSLAELVPNEFRWALPMSELVRFRRMDQLRYPMGLFPHYPSVPAPLVDNVLGLRSSRVFEELKADNLFDSYKYEKPNYFTVVGTMLNIKASWPVDRLEAVYYRWPNITSDAAAQLESWITDQFPDAIAEEASAAVFKMIGKDDEHARFTALFAENLSIIRSTDI